MSGSPPRLCYALPTAALRDAASAAALPACVWRAQQAAVELRVDAQLVGRDWLRLVDFITSVGPARCVLKFEVMPPPAVLAQLRALPGLWLDVDVQLLAGEGDFAAALRALRARSQPCHLLISYHDNAPGEDPHPLLATYRAVAQGGAQCFKVALLASRCAQQGALLRLLQAARAEPTYAACPLLPVLMGEGGQWLRCAQKVLVPEAPFVYVRTPHLPATGAGQLPAAVLQQDYRFDAQQPDFKLLGLVGAPVGHSFSPLYYQTALAAAGKRALYVNFLVTEPLAAFFTHVAPHLPLLGLSVTHPHKEAAFHFACATSERAQQLGAVNTLRAGAAGYEGENTDAPALKACLQRLAGQAVGSEARQEANAKANPEAALAILGAGASARAAAQAATQLGWRVVFINRSRARAQNLAAAYPGSRALALADVLAGKEPLTGLCGLINSLPAAVLAAGLAAALAAVLPDLPWLLDCNYPGLGQRTADLRLALAGRVARSSDGLPMFLRQAALQYAFLLGQAPPRAAALAVLRRAQKLVAQS